MYQAYAQTYIGKHYRELPTPALLVDVDILDANLNAMSRLLEGTSCMLRPHIKAHKCPSIAHLQLRAGAIGVTCAKLGEAQVMVESGITDILLANQVIGKAKIRLLCALNRRASVMPALDDPQNARQIAAIAREMGVVVPVLIEVDIGLGRCGVRTLEQALALAQTIGEHPNLKLMGLQAYEGPFRGQSWEEKAKAVAQSVGKAAAFKRALRDAGFPMAILSCASTGTGQLSARHPEVTEIQPGSYALMETAYYKNGVPFPFNQALTAISTVISRQGDRLVLDAGQKAIACDQGAPTLLEDPAAVLSLHEEHALLDATPALADCRPGDVLRLYPGHCCATANLHDVFFAVRNGVVEAVWPITARGRFD